MTTLDVHANLTYDVGAPTSFAFSIIAARTAHQRVTSEQFDITPDVDVTFEPYGEGAHQLLRFDAPAGSLDLSYRATISVDGDDTDPALLTEATFAQIPAAVLPYLNPSRYCESDRLVRFASDLFGDVDPGYPRVQAVADWVGSNVHYEPGATDGSSGTTDVLLQRAGVCRDFAHVSISLCRALGIPARYVSGYGVGVEPQDFHGFFEAYLGDDWYLFDPTGMAAINSLARIGFGRDAADTPFSTFVGDASLVTKEITVEPVGDPEPEPDATSTA
ncbi:MAG: transglutaminase family protein [Ilumatobacter sp.]|nr:transglutaminase family protein [Ilumatobacter sp.]